MGNRRKTLHSVWVTRDLPKQTTHRPNRAGARLPKELTMNNAKQKNDAAAKKREDELRTKCEELSDLTKHPGWKFHLAKSIRFRIAHHKNALLTAEGKDVIKHQAGYRELEWLLTQFRELNARLHGTPLFSDGLSAEWNEEEYRLDLKRVKKKAPKMAKAEASA